MGPSGCRSNHPSSPGGQRVDERLDVRGDQFALPIHHDHALLGVDHVGKDMYERALCEEVSDEEHRQERDAEPANGCIQARRDIAKGEASVHEQLATARPWPVRRARLGSEAPARIGAG